MIKKWSDNLNIQLTSDIIQSAYEVQNVLGKGFLEKVYENALYYELGTRGFAVDQQVTIAVEYKGVEVGSYQADLIVNNEILVELKCCNSIDKSHVAQVLNYLKATKLKTGLILNFSTSGVQVKRIVI